MNNQEIFDHVVAFLRKQGRPARVPGRDVDVMDSKCMYHTEGGLKCAVGCLIPDELYDPEMEGMFINGDGAELIHEALEHVGIDCSEPLTLRLLAELQVVHDGPGYKTDYWERDWEHIAKKFHLEYSRP